jgi:hypothetical protein
VLLITQRAEEIVDEVATVSFFGAGGGLNTVRRPKGMAAASLLDLALGLNDGAMLRLPPPPTLEEVAAVWRAPQARSRSSGGGGGVEGGGGVSGETVGEEKCKCTYEPCAPRTLATSSAFCACERETKTERNVCMGYMLHVYVERERCTYVCMCMYACMDTFVWCACARARMEWSMCPCICPCVVCMHVYACDPR